MEVKQTGDTNKKRLSSNKAYSGLAVFFALCVLLSQFARVSIIDGAVVATSQLPLRFSETASSLNLVESILSFLIPALLFCFCGMLFYEICQAEPSTRRMSRYQKCLLLPLILLALSAVERTFYVYMYEGHFSVYYLRFDFISALVLSLVYLLLVYGKKRAAQLFLVLCLAFALVEVARFSLPGMSYAYTAGVSFYVSTFIAAIMFYLAYACVGLSMGE